MGLFGRSRHQPEDEQDQESFRQPQPSALPPESVAFETVLGPGASFRGKLSSPGSVRLEGTFVGDLELEGNILIGEHARITADINAANVTIAGAVRGNISGQRVQLLRTGRVWGDIQSSSISTEDGAFIRGTITMRGGDIPPVFAEMAAETGSLPPPVEPAVPEEADEFAAEAEAEAEAEATFESEMVEEPMEAEEAVMVEEPAVFEEALEAEPTEPVEEVFEAEPPELAEPEEAPAEAELVEETLMDAGLGFEVPTDEAPVDEGLADEELADEELADEGLVEAVEEEPADDPLEGFDLEELPDSDDPLED